MLDSSIKKKRIKKNDEFEYKIALSVYDNVVIRLYTIIQWFPAGTTFSTRKPSKPENRWEFIGNLIEEHSLLGKKLIDTKNNDIKANQQGYGYIN